MVVATVVLRRAAASFSTTASSPPPQLPRVAVVGGGITGTLCSLVLQNRGLAVPHILDAGQHGVGGRMRGYPGNLGMQFIRGKDPKLAGVLQMLESSNIVQSWKGKFGMLGTQSGHFLPSEIIGASGVRSNTMMRNDGVFEKEESGGPDMTFGTMNASASNKDTETSSNNNNDRSTASDGGDFCGFVSQDTMPTYVGIPTMADICPNICQLSNIQVQHGCQVEGAEIVKPTNENGDDGGWKVYCRNAEPQMFDALVLATHDASLASSIVESIATQEEQATMQDTGSSSAVSISQRLSMLANDLQSVRTKGKVPVYTISVQLPPSMSLTGESESSSILQPPFDAASVPGSSVLQFISRNSSKPGILQDNEQGEIWTAVSTSQFAQSVLDNDTDYETIQTYLVQELLQLLSLSSHAASKKSTSSPPVVLQPDQLVNVSIKRWRAGFNNQSLNLLEDCVTLAPWRLCIAGEYIRKFDTHPTPFEAAALSGLYAGERVSSFFPPLPPQ